MARHRAGTDHYAGMHAGFRWQVPERFNIGEVCCRRWSRGAAGLRTAIRVHRPGQPPRLHSYAELQAGADALGSTLRALGVERGDRVAIVLPQRLETAVAYMAVFQLGAVAVPLSMLFGPEALEYRLQDSGAVLAICDEHSAPNLAAVRAACPALRTVLAAGPASAHADAAFPAPGAEAAPLAPATTAADDPAVLIYTSGTTGPPKGALVPHRALIGNLSGFVCSQNWFGFAPDRGVGQPTAAPAPDRPPPVFWSPADWAWTGGLMDALLPTLYFGLPIVACGTRFSPDTAFTLLEQHGVTHSFLFPTALKAMMKAYPRPRELFELRLQAVMSAGEAVGDAVFAYCRDQLGVVVNEMFGQTEINYIVGNCAMNGSSSAAVGWPARAGSMGRPYPGHRVAVLDEAGAVCAPGAVGEVAVNRYDRHGDPDPVFFLGYWKNLAATQGKFSGDWCRTGDLAMCDADGYLWYQGRADDVFKSAGYRIGPSEIENCLVKHPAVANAAVVPKPDPERGALVKAYVVLAAEARAERARVGVDVGDFDVRLVAALQAHVRGRLAPYEYPKEIEFIDALPMTTTGKVQRRVLRLQEEQRAHAARAV